LYGKGTVEVLGNCRLNHRGELVVRAGFLFRCKPKSNWLHDRGSPSGSVYQAALSENAKGVAENLGEGGVKTKKDSKDGSKKSE
jgi:hypothetical protein